MGLVDGWMPISLVGQRKMRLSSIKKYSTHFKKLLILAAATLPFAAIRRAVSVLRCKFCFNTSAVSKFFFDSLR